MTTYTNLYTENGKSIITRLQRYVECKDIKETEMFQVFRQSKREKIALYSFAFPFLSSDCMSGDMEVTL